MIWPFGLLRQSTYGVIYADPAKPDCALFIMKKPMIEQNGKAERN